MEQQAQQPLRDANGRLLPGTPALPGAGRRPGSRAELGEQFCKQMLEDFEQHGPETISQFREKDPAGYCKAIVAMLPRASVIDVQAMRVFALEMTGVYDEGELPGPKYLELEAENDE